MNDQNPRFKNSLHVPRMKPYSNDTWEVQIQLDNDQEQSATESLIFPASCRIVGILPTLTINGNTGGGLLEPTTDDIALQFDINQQRRYTQQIGQTTQAQRGQGFVTLSAMNTNFRDLNIVVDSPRPQAGFTVRWKRFTQGSPIYVSQIVSLALFVEIDD